MINFILFFALLGGATSQQSFKCPHEYGFYPHATSCDKYYKCENNQAELKTCGNGLGFEASDPKFLAENCDYLHNVDCGDRTELEPPQKTANCPRLYGIFHDEERCDTFWSCWNGEASRYTCAPGLAYDADARVCMWADQVPGCKVNQNPNDFQCPDQKNQPGTFSRHAHPDNCRSYFICLDGSAREYGCPEFTVFKIGPDGLSGQCEDPQGVEGCENFYGDELKNVKKSQLFNGGDDGSYKTGTTNKPTLRKIKKQKVAEQQEVVAKQPREQPREQQREQPREQQREQQRLNRPQKKEQDAPVGNLRLLQRNQQRPTTTSTTTSTTTTTTAKPTTAKDLENYYYYDDDEVVPANKQ